MKSTRKAKKKTHNNINDCVTQELNKINKQIDGAIAKGQFSITNDGTLHPATRERLESLGYKVQVGSQYNESYYSVSWS